MKKAVIVNGVPASGKSTVARNISKSLGWPLLTLDTVKEALFTQLGTGDREYNRMLGRASYKAIFALIADFPENSVVVIDAWFGFQPLDILSQYIESADIAQLVEVWCHAPPETIGARYLRRTEKRSIGHLGSGYVPELIALAGRAKPTGLFPIIDLDTSQQGEQLDIISVLRDILNA
jgi:glucokinase